MIVTPRRPGDREEGSIILMMLVIFVASALVVTLTASVLIGMKSSRRAGDAANALQLADAGVNHAVRQITDDTSTAIGATISISGNLGSAGSYSVSATKESVDDWHLTAVGTDATGVKRKVQSDAIAEKLFSNAIFATNALTLGSGSAVDSYKDGSTRENTCTLLGFVGSNTPASTNLTVNGSGNGVRNCTQGKTTPPPTGYASYAYAYDGCVAYDDVTPPQASYQATGDACGKVIKAYPKFQVFQPDSSGIASSGPLTCNSQMYLPALADGRRRYRYSSIILGDGCVLVDPAGTATQTNPLILFSDGSITIGTGSNDKVNRYPGSCPQTANSGNNYYSTSHPLSDYCTNWPGKLQIYGIGAGTVSLANHVDFWGVVYAPNYPLQSTGGSPHVTVFGSLYVSSVSSAAQFEVHYDEALGGITTGKYSIRNWREEPLP